MPMTRTAQRAAQQINANDPRWQREVAQHLRTLRAAQQTAACAVAALMDPKRPDWSLVCLVHEVTTPVVFARITAPKHLRAMHDALTTLRTSVDGIRVITQRSDVTAREAADALDEIIGVIFDVIGGVA